MIDPAKPDYGCTPASALRPRAWYAPSADENRPGGPAVTILSAYYNTGPVFHETARCVFAQSLQNWEWLIVNDASTDPEALATLDEYRRCDPRVRVIDLAVNSGPSAARNAGYAAARAPLVYQLDSDDLIEPTAIEKCAWFLSRRPDLSFCTGYEVGFGAQEYLWTHGFHSRDLFLRECPVGAHAVMVRREAHARAGGYDESNRAGMEDWEFWLRCAHHGMWGETIPEYLAWYRRRACHAGRWSNWDNGEKQQAFHQALRDRFRGVFAGRIPQPQARPPLPYDDIPRDLPLCNPLAKSRPRLLMIVPWFAMGGADKFNLRLVEQLCARGWEVSLASTLSNDQSWLPEFARLTPDIFVLADFLSLADRPLFLRYLIESRRPDVVLMSHSEMGYLTLPYLRAHSPGTAFADYNHMEEAYWKQGGYPRYSAASSAMLDLSIASSHHLKSWMVERGADAARVEVCTTNEDPEQWKPDPQRRRRVRDELAIPDGRAVLLYAGRLCDQKQPRVLCETLAGLRRRGCEFTAVIAGDGPDRGIIEEAVSREGLEDSVVLLGAVSNARVRELACAADIFFLPSLWEGISLAIYEAMSAGLAIIGANVGGQRELVTPECGTLIERGTPASEAAAYVEALAPLTADPSLARRMGEAGRRRIIDHFQLSHMGDRMDTLLRRAAQAAARGEGRPPMPVSDAHEIAVRGIEYLRLHDLADYLWRERESLRLLVAGHGAGSGGTPSSLIEARPCPAAAELAAIEQSRFFGWVRAAKATPVYRAIARLRWGSGWSAAAEASEPAERRLTRLKASRSYRVIQAIKATGIYRAYAIRKYGSLPPGAGLNGTAGANGQHGSHLNGVSSEPSHAGKP